MRYRGSCFYHLVVTNISRTKLIFNTTLFVYVVFYKLNARFLLKQHKLREIQAKVNKI